MSKRDLRIINRRLAKGNQGVDVEAWQAFADTMPDGDFGDLTHKATCRFQTSVGLVPNGVVCGVTLAKALPIFDERIASLIDDGRYRFLEAKHYTKAKRVTPIRHIVIHSAEVPERCTSAESVARYFATTDREASAHYCVDNDSIVRCVKDDFTAWHAPGLNRSSIGIELSGYASQTEEQWLDAYSRAMLSNAAGLIAKLCKRWRIPVEFVAANELLAGAAGITTHVEVTRAFKKGDHYDPGQGFPMATFLEMVRNA